MDFETDRRKKLLFIMEAFAVAVFFVFIGYQIKLYIDDKVEKNKLAEEAVKEQLKHSDTVSGDAAESAEAMAYSFTGDHPYSVVELSYGLSSLTIETENGSAIYTNGKSAGVNLDVREITSGGSVSAVDLSRLGTEYLSLSGIGGDPVITLRYADGYYVKVALNHAIQSGFDKDGNVKVYNLQKGDDITVTYGFNIDSKKYPGAEKMVFSGMIGGNGALNVSVKGTIFTVSGLSFESGMLSVADPLTGGSRGIPANGANGFFTYDLKSGTISDAPVRK